MKRISFKLLMLGLITGIMSGCQNDEVNSSDSSSSADEVTALVDVAQASAQLASGASFRISGSSTDSTGTTKPHGKHGGHHRCVTLDGISLLVPTDELLAIVDAESAGDFRGLRISRNGGATVTNFNADGDTVSIPTPSPAKGGPQGCSFSGKQFPTYDSLLATITKTIIDFGSGVTYSRDTVSITRAGKIIITRSGSSPAITEVITFEGYTVNGIAIEGTKTRVNTYDEATGTGTSTTSVSGGKIILTDGTVSTWTSDKKRTSTITLDVTNNRPVSGTIVTEVDTKVTAEDGTVIYSHQTTTPLTENIACDRRRHAPVSGVLETIYRDNTIIVDFGDGTCDTTITLTVNGVTTTKTIGE